MPSLDRLHIVVELFPSIKERPDVQWRVQCDNNVILFGAKPTPSEAFDAACKAVEELRVKAVEENISDDDNVFYLLVEHE